MEATEEKKEPDTKRVHTYPLIRVRKLDLNVENNWRHTCYCVNDSKTFSTPCRLAFACFYGTHARACVCVCVCVCFYCLTFRLYVCVWSQQRLQYYADKIILKPSPYRSTKQTRVRPRRPPGSFVKKKTVFILPQNHQGIEGAAVRGNSHA